MTYYNRTLGLDDKIFARCNEIFTKSLQGGKELTRLELSKSLEKSRIKAQGQKLGHIVMQSELDGVLCSGAMRGKQFTYALLEERVPYHKILNRNEALFELAHRYFSSHGPATVNDFAWWSGLTVKDANLGIEMIRSQYTCETVEGKMYWFSQKTSYPKTITTKAFLMSVYDEYIIAYKDRNAIFDLSKSKQKIGNAIFNLVIVLDGKVVGTWKRIFKNNAVEVTIHPFNKLGKNEEDNFRKVADDYGIYLGMPVSFFVSPLTGIES
jgi:hypothetical protein